MFSPLLLSSPPLTGEGDGGSPAGEALPTPFGDKFLREDPESGVKCPGPN